MSTRARNFLIFTSLGLLVACLCVAVAAGSYFVGQGRGQAREGPEAGIPAGQTQVIQEPPLAPPTDPPLGETQGPAAQTTPAEPTAAPAAATATPSGPDQPVELDDEDVELMLEVWEIIDNEFDGVLPTNEQVLYEAIASSLELLGDDFTRFVPPDLAERAREQLEGSYEGIGAFVDMDEEGNIVIVRAFEGQPAERAGLRSGDVITHVDGVPIAGMTFEEILVLVKGDEGTEVRLTVRRASEPGSFDVVVERALIEIPIIESEMLRDGIAYVRLTSFNSNAETRLHEAIEAFLAGSPRGLILDLRDNPGGFLDQSVAVADLFLPEGVVLIQRDREGDEEIFHSDDGDLAEEIPLVVLVNEGSASASEIVAGAIQDHGRAVIVGATTFGKGSVQQTHTLSDGAELRVTIARWYTPSNQSIDQSGIAPDIEVATPEEFGGENDTQLQRALEQLLKTAGQP
ncbi:MAG: S41 family peptidase [Candidatus Promineifilaceae bacterium]